jgi:hypothetical protein
LPLKELQILFIRSISVFALIKLDQTFADKCCQMLANVSNFDRISGGIAERKTLGAKQFGIAVVASVIVNESDQADVKSLGEVGKAVPAFGLPYGRPEDALGHELNPKNVRRRQRVCEREPLRSLEAPLSADDFKIFTHIICVPARLAKVAKGVYTPDSITVGA